MLPLSMNNLILMLFSSKSFFGINLKSGIGGGGYLIIASYQFIITCYEGSMTH